MAELRRRIVIAEYSAAHRIEFFQLTFITSGTCIHTVDFKDVHCAKGSLLTLRPSQAQKFDIKSDWDGWILIFKPEFLLPIQSSGNIVDTKLAVDLNDLPGELILPPEHTNTLSTLIHQMHSDSQLLASIKDLNNLLRHQLYALLLRMQIFHAEHIANTKLEAISLVRFKRFQQLVEKDFMKWHQVSDYANAMGCSVKSLTRAVLAASGTSPKFHITSRVNLEAKRLLAHTALPIGLIGDRIGFDEATNFVKFFKRETGCLPSEFRRKNTGN